MNTLQTALILYFLHPWHWPDRPETLPQERVLVKEENDTCIPIFIKIGRFKQETDLVMWHDDLCESYLVPISKSVLSSNFYVVTQTVFQLKVQLKKNVYER